MTLSNIITFDLLRYYDSKIKAWIKNLKASASQDGLLSKEDYSKLESLQSGAQVNTIEGIQVNGSLVQPDANKKVNIEVPTDYYTQNEVDSKDTSILENILGRIWSNKKADGSGNFQTKYNHADGSYAQMWNESDGGGSQYYNKTKDVISYVGVNDGAGNDIFAQIYAKNKGTNTGVRINVTPNGAYYNVTNSINTDARYEIATKGDIQDFAGTVPTSLSAFTNDSNFVNETQVDNKIATAVSSAVKYKGTVETIEDLPTSNQKNGDMYNVRATDMNYVWNADETKWDPQAPTIVLETATTAQIEELFAEED